MTVLRVLLQGARTAVGHPALALLYYLTITVPALLLVAMASAVVAPLETSAFAARALAGEWLPVWLDLAGSDAGNLSSLLAASGILVLLAALTHVVLSGGVVETLLERPDPGSLPLLDGAVRHAWRFLRATLWYLTGCLLALAGVGLLVWGLRTLARQQGDARWDLAALGAAGVLGFLLVAPLGLAYDLTRLAVARHDQGSTWRGLLRALVRVFRHPWLFLPLAAVLLALGPALVLGYYAVRHAFTPASTGALLTLLLAQQAVVLARGFLKVVRWGSVLACYRELGEPELCRPGAVAGPTAAGQGGGDVDRGVTVVTRAGDLAPGLPVFKPETPPAGQPGGL